MSHIASNSQVFEVSKILSTVFMMSEVQWTAVENVVFFSKGSTVIKLPVLLTNLRNFLCRNEMSEDESYRDNAEMLFTSRSGEQKS